ncbi:hypothetical protein GJ744_007154 [Endocarpon pusillum]|uniref:Uncharacterized protein n=1 Tax=Endocarpon pusillum TaxID=364733 RepID=A0A8H7ARY3_9EURO|nr:hypothetical protein GJ744_007154 [Endocarpon pusillum]
MPRGAHPPTWDRPQTLREARRAYQKAGRVPKLSAAQIRAAERAVEADKRAKDILAKQKRAREAKRKKEEQEAKQREEQRKLVQLGRLPEESLWGKVRASQPRLHTFFGVPRDGKVEAQFSGASLDVQKRKSDARARSVEHSAENSQGSGQIQSSAPPALKSQRASCLPALQKGSASEKCMKQHTTQPKHTYERSALPAAPVNQGQPDTQFFFSGSQILSEFADDKALEAELNGQSSPPETVRDPSSHTSKRTAALQTGRPSKKRRMEDLSPATASSAKAARAISVQRSPLMLNNRAAEQFCTSSGSSLTQPGVHLPAVSGLDDIPTASQVEAMFWSQDFEDNGAHSDKENLAPCPTDSKITNSTVQTKSNKLAAAKPQRPCPSTLKLPVKEGSPSQQSALRPQEDDKVLDNCHGSDDYFDNVFGDDFDKNLLGLPSQVLGLKKSDSQMVSKKRSAEVLGVHRFDLPKVAKQASPLRSKVGDSPYSTQNSCYDLNGVNDEDLWELADMFNSS